MEIEHNVPLPTRAERRRRSQEQRDRVNARSREWNRVNRERKLANQKAWRLSNPEKVKATRLKSKLKKKGVDVSALPAVPKKCPICRKVKPLVADHCHTKNTFRGWICGHCNKMLGFALDDPAILRRGAIYLG